MKLTASMSAHFSSLLLLSLAAPLAAQDYPVKPIRFTICCAPGGSADLVTRLLAEKLAARMGQPVLPENRIGGSGVLSNGDVVKAAPDGHTMTLLTGGFPVAAVLMKQRPYDPIKDFQFVSTVVSYPFFLSVRTDYPARNLRELIASAKANPGRINYASGGNGSPQHIAMALFASTAGINMTHIPYKGATQAALDVAAGQVPVTMQGIGTVAALIRGGKLRLLGVGTRGRLPAFPAAPTLSESGLPGFEFNSFFAITAPAGTPKDIVARLNAEIVKALADPDVREKLTALGFTIRGTSPEELNSVTRAQLAKYAQLIKAANITNE